MLAGGESIAATKAEIDAGAAEALTQFDQLSPGHKELDAKAEAALVFPRVTKAGVGIAGEYGEGVLLINGKSVGYYSLSSASVGLTFGAETHKEIILFMNMQALNRFTSSDGWSAGADAGAAVASKGAGAEYDSKTKGRPVQGFVFSEKGLIGDLSLEGSKVKKIER
jgi:lipid-binding SYLF domain-containing protein